MLLLCTVPLLVGRARAMGMQCQAPFVELRSSTMRRSTRPRRKYSITTFVQTLTYIDKFKLVQYVLSAASTDRRQQTAEQVVVKAIQGDLN